MRSDWLRILFGFVVLVGLGFGAGACEDTHIDNDADDAIEDVADDTGDAVDEAADDVEDALD